MGSEEKGTLCTKIHPQNFPLFPYSAFLSSCLWSIPHLGPGPTELIQAWQVFEINGSSAGEKEKLRNGSFVILALHLCGICQNFSNKDPNTLLWSSVSSLDLCRRHSSLPTSSQIMISRDTHLLQATHASVDLM